MAEIVLFNDVNGHLGFSRYAGPYCIATALRKNGYNVQVIEFFADMTHNELMAAVDAHVDSKTLYVGFAATLWTKHQSYEEKKDMWVRKPGAGMSALFGVFVDLFPHEDDVMLNFIDRVKSRNSRTKIVVGGYKALAKKIKAIDFWVLGQGETSSVAIANHLKHGSNLIHIETDIGKIVTDKMYPFNGFSTSKLVWDESDHIFPGESLPIETARGCIFKCSFCSFNLNGKKFGDYTKEADTLREELLRNYDERGTDDYMICDDTINDSKQKVEMLHSVFTSLPFKVKLSGYARLDIIAANPGMEDLLQEMGMVAISYGVETFHPVAAKHIGKSGNAVLLQDTLHRLKQKWGGSVFQSACFIAGLPFEPIESIRNTFEWLYRDDCPIDAVAMNRFIPKLYYPAINPSNISDDEMISYGFIRMNGGWQYQNINTIEQNLDKYKIVMNPSNKYDWTSSELSRQQVIDLITEFNSDPRCRQKFAFTNYHGFNRMKNLGYSHNQLRSLYMDDPVIVEDAIDRRENIKNQYLTKII